MWRRSAGRPPRCPTRRATGRLPAGRRHEHPALAPAGCRHPSTPTKAEPAARPTYRASVAAEKKPTSWNVLSTIVDSPDSIARRSRCLLISISNASVPVLVTRVLAAAASYGVSSGVRVHASQQRDARLFEPWQHDRELARSAEQPALAKRRAERQRDGEVLLGLDPFGQHGRPGPLGLGVHRTDDAGDLRRRLLLHQREVELDHVRAEQGQQRQRVRVSADVVDRDPPPAARGSGRPSRAVRAGRAVSARSVISMTTWWADLPPTSGEYCARARASASLRPRRLRLDVDEQRPWDRIPAVARTGERGGPARLVQPAAPIRLRAAAANSTPGLLQSDCPPARGRAPRTRPPTPVSRSTIGW